MKAIGLYKYLPIENQDSLNDIEIPQPKATGRDLLVAVKAISVNPIDTKVRATKDLIEETPKILGWDAAGEQVEYFTVGDQVFYAGDITRPGSNSEFQLVDERIVGKKPQSLNFSEAAALPLTTITAWEALFNRLEISTEGKDGDKSILIIGGAGGVGSIAIQLAHKLANLQVIATASRLDSQNWCHRLGADFIINHRNPLDKELVKTGIPDVDYILCCNNTSHHWEAITAAIKPQGKICSIVDTNSPVDLNLLKRKSATFVWEFMFTRSIFQTADIIEQQYLLNSVSDLIDQNVLITTASTLLQPINAENLRQAHALIEQGDTIGKVVLTKWA